VVFYKDSFMAKDATIINGGLICKHGHAGIQVVTVLCLVVQLELFSLVKGPFMIVDLPVQRGDMVTNGFLGREFLLPIGLVLPCFVLG